MSRPGSTQAAAALPSPPPVCIPQRPWTESFSPHPGHALERLKESKVPLSPLPIPSESLHGTGSEVVPWPPLNVQSKSRSTTSAGGSRSRRSSALSSVAPRLPTPSAMSAVQTESSRSGGGGWAAALKSGIFAALGQMASDAGEDEGDVPPHPDAPLAERLTAVTPRSTRHRRGTRPADLEEGGGAGRMVPVESEESSFALAPSRTNSSVSESKPSRLYKNIKLSQRRHESQIRALNHGKRLGASAGTGIQPARSVSSMYSSTSSSGYTTDIGELEEEGGGAVSHEVLGMYDIGELEEDGGHGTDGKAGVRKIGAVV
ncbi:hypothetical protein FRB90_008244 [Tulasnella sp. 427]|nr:hypothetical protein FRB90_008244 [Tulasnella sp. 427]